MTHSNVYKWTWLIQMNDMADKDLEAVDESAKEYSRLQRFLQWLHTHNVYYICTHICINHKCRYIRINICKSASSNGYTPILYIIYVYICL